MTEQEAEVALLTLGGQLKWERTASTEAASVCLCGSSMSFGRYRILVRDSDLPMAFYLAELIDSTGMVLLPYPSYAAAKAACEIHYATGDWE